MTRRTRAGLGGVALAVVGCSKILGAGGYQVAAEKDASVPTATGAEASTDAQGPGREYASSCGGILYGSATCRDCVQKFCCDEATACGADPACAATVRCEERCAVGDEACRSRCAYIWTFASTELDGLTQCETQCEGCRSGRALVRDPLCSFCESQECPDVLDAFSKDRDALALKKCGVFGGTCYPNTDPTCVEACKQEHSAGQPNVDALDACNAGVCATACTQSTADWDCLGSVEWPDPPLTPRSIDVVVPLVKSEDFSTRLVGFDGKACLEQDVTCAAPRAIARSDSAGVLSLTIRPPPPLSTRFFGHLLVTSSDPAYDSALLYVSPPPRRDAHFGFYPIASRTQRDASAAAIGVKPDRTKGTIAFDGYSCSFRGGEGVVVTIDSGERAYYYGPSGTLDPKATQASIGGLGAILNVEPGTRTVESRLATTGARVGSFPVQVLADSFTEIVMTPTPDGN